MNIEEYTDREIVQAILQRNTTITKEYLYRKCYPLFHAIYSNYYTDCHNVIEFINEIYILILTPSKKTGKCQLQNFKGESTLFSWLKAVSLFYCYAKYERKNHIPQLDTIYQDEESDDSDRFDAKYGSISIDLTNINQQDVLILLNQMPNQRYSTLIRMRYLEEKTNEETAKAMNMTMEVFYNTHKRAKAQFMDILAKEERV